jgi:hypothetical protein
MDKQIQKTLDQIKWLLVLQLQSQGIASKDIAKVLDVDSAIISRKVPRRKKNNKSEQEV